MSSIVETSIKKTLLKFNKCLHNNLKENYFGIVTNNINLYNDCVVKM